MIDFEKVSYKDDFCQISCLYPDLNYSKVTLELSTLLTGARQRLKPAAPCTRSMVQHTGRGHRGIPKKGLGLVFSPAKSGSFEF